MNFTKTFDNGKSIKVVALDLGLYEVTIVQASGEQSVTFVDLLEALILMIETRDGK